MSIISVVKNAAKFVAKPIAKVIPSKAAVKGFASKLGASKIKNVFTKIGTKISSSKVGSIFASKGGKIGLAVAGGAALVGGSIFLYNKLAGNSDVDKTEPNEISEDEIDKTEKLEQAPKDEDKVEPKKTEPNNDDGVDKTDKLKPAPKDEDKVEPKKTEPNNDDGVDKTDKLKPAPKDEDKAEPKKTEPNKAEEKYHTVVRGDNVWNIAKAHLKEMHKDDPNYKPSNAEILQHTKELMAANKLHYEADNYRVIIRPGDKLKLTA